MTAKSDQNKNKSSDNVPSLSIDQELQKFRSLYDNQPTVLITISIDKTIISINKKGATDLGYLVEELLGQDVSLLYVPQELKRLTNQIQYVLLDPGQHSSHEMRMVKKNGQEFWVRETIYTIAEQPLNNVFLVCENISYQKNTEMEAKNLAQSLQNMLDASPLGVLVYRLNSNDDLILISTNESAVNILKINVYGLISKKIEEIFPALLEQGYVEKFKAVLKTGKPLFNQNIDYSDKYLKGIYEYSVIKLSDKVIAIFFTEVTEKQIAYTALKQSELKYKALFESANDAILLLQNQNIVDCNKKTEELFKLNKTKLIAKNPFSFSPDIQPDGRLSYSKIKEYINDALEGKSQFFEWRYKLEDGGFFDSEISLNKIQFENEAYLQVVIRDITDRKSAEQTISEQKREIATLMSNLPGMAYRCSNNLNWTMEFVSEGCYQLTGYRKDELLNDKVVSYASLIHPDDQLLVSETIQNSVNNHESFTLLYRIVTWQGVEKWVWEKGRAVYDDNGNVKCLEGFITDISDRKLTEEKLILMAHGLKCVSECVCITTLRDKIIFVNKSFCKVYGYTESELINKPITFVRSKNNDPEIIKKILPETLAGGWTGKLVNKRKNGEEFLIHLSTSLITDDMGKPIALAGVSTDITNISDFES